MKRLFSERHGGMRPRVFEKLCEDSRAALLNLVQSRVDEEWFGLSFPNKCDDGYVYAGTNVQNLKVTMRGYQLLLPWDPEPYSDEQVFDLIEFSYEYIAEPKTIEFHRYMGHHHYSYDQETGRLQFANDVNRILERNGIAFELSKGEVVRLSSAVLNYTLIQFDFNTGDIALDNMLAVAKEKFLNRSLEVRKESLEKLWDAWERLKTITPGKDKKAGILSLLDGAAQEPIFRNVLENEATSLTEMGNRFMIRHTEMDRVQISESTQVDYFFQRMFAMIVLLLKSRQPLSG